MNRTVSTIEQRALFGNFLETYIKISQDSSFLLEHLRQNSNRTLNVVQHLEPERPYQISALGTTGATNNNGWFWLSNLKLASNALFCCTISSNLIFSSPRDLSVQLETCLPLGLPWWYSQFPNKKNYKNTPSRHNCREKHQDNSVIVENSILQW